MILLVFGIWTVIFVSMNIELTYTERVAVLAIGFEKGEVKRLLSEHTVIVRAECILKKKKNRM